MTDAGLKDLAPLKQLQWLNLIGTKVTDAGLKSGGKRDGSDIGNMGKQKSRLT